MAQRSDIEDVLSSIRRLVADEAGSAAEARATRALVLGQAQRVTEPEDPFQTVQGLPEPAVDDDFEDEAPAQAPNLPEAVAEIPNLLAPEPQEEPVLDMAEALALAPVEEADAPDEDAEDDIGPVDLSDLSGTIESDEALRELIAEIVRQELAGALGERITRNVRKLVRRELRQMMSGEEFD